MEVGGLVKARLEGWADFHSSSRPKNRKGTPMSQSAMAEAKVTSVPHDVPEAIESLLSRQTVLIASAEPAVSGSLRDLLQVYPLKTIWAKSVSEVRAVVAKENVTACFCDFWLVDGTYRDVVRHLRRQPVEIPTVIVCEPACSHEYRDYLSALNIRAFDFMCHPYSKIDLERILR